MSEGRQTRVQETFKPWRPITERERELLRRVMQRAAWKQLDAWDDEDAREEQGQ